VNLSGFLILIFGILNPLRHLKQLIIAPAYRNIHLIAELSRTFPEPFGILYILTVRKAAMMKDGINMQLPRIVL
jgi:hypothetical protein